MITDFSPIEQKIEQLEAKKSSLGRIGKYALFRLITLLITVLITVYLTIIIANWGGAMDDAVRANIQLSIFSRTNTGWLRDVPEEEREEIINETVLAMENAMGLNDPFLLRSFRWLKQGITLNWGETRARVTRYRSVTKDIRSVILDSLPRTLLIFGTAYLVLFFLSIFFALSLTKLYGSWLDKLMITLSPLSSAPAWIFGVLLNFFFLTILGTSVFSGGGLDAWPSDFEFSFIFVVLKHLAVPLLAIILSGIFQAIYSWRTFFLIYSSEDYVEVAKAKGLPEGRLNRRYILKPLLPSIITSFALLFVTLWQEVIALEYVFNVDGIGSVFLLNLKAVPPNTRLIVAIVTTFAYLLAITVFLLDLIYAWVDPRVKIGILERNNHQVSKTREKGFVNRIKNLFQPKPAGYSSLREKTKEIDLLFSKAKQKSSQEDLAQILEAFQVIENAKANWLVDPRSGQQLTVDRVYPALNLGIIFTPTTRNLRPYLTAFEQKQLNLLVIDSRKPLSTKNIKQLHSILSSLARRIAHGDQSHQEKAAWMLRVNQAKSITQKYLKPPPSAAIVPKLPQWDWKGWRRRFWIGLKNRASRLVEYPSAIFGLVIIILMLGVSTYTVIAVPYQEIIVRWRSSDESWRRLPKHAPPAWVNFFRKDDLPETIQMSSQDENTLINQEGGGIGIPRKTVTQVSDEMWEILISFPFEYSYSTFPQEIAGFIDSRFDEKLPLISIILNTPDGREINVGSFTSDQQEEVFYFSKQDKLKRKFRTEFPVQALLSAPDSDPLVPLQGNYQLQFKGFFFEEDPDMDIDLVIYGQVYGIAGTDGNRRDLTVPLLWGMPIALFFGILAAVGTSVSSMLIAAVSSWYGGWVDNLAQRITEINLIIPFLPVSIMIYVLYSKSLWTILGVTVALSIFGNEIKYYRSIFLQVMEEKYIEAAQSYGASNRRLIIRYLIPRILPIMIPKLVILVPSYVFLEATLTLLGVSDPVLPTWGKLLVEGFSSDIYRGVYHLLLEPLALLLLVGFAFVLLGISLERIFQPRLRER
jgi:peptide/nickel transport system permease protein